MAKICAALCVVVLVLNVISTSPAQANWFGKRGDQEDILGFLLRQSDAQDSTLSAESAMMAIERVVMKWQMARKGGLPTPTQK